MSRIGVLIPGRPDDEAVLQPFRENLRDLGHIEGRNLHLEIRSANGQLDRLPGLAAELVRDKVDLIAAWMTPSVLAAKRATTDIPIVMIGAGDPVGTGLVASLASPGGNITGIAGVTAGLAGKNLEFLKDMLPSLHRAAALCNAPDPFSQPLLRQIQSAGRILRVEVVPIMVARQCLKSRLTASSFNRVCRSIAPLRWRCTHHFRRLRRCGHFPTSAD
jgi:putative ABC transport system substrate-binding protein